MSAARARVEIDLDHAGDDDQEHEPRDRQPDVGHPRQDRVDATAEVRTGRPDGRRKPHRQQARCDREHEDVGTAIDEEGRIVATSKVGSQPVGERGSLVDMGDVRHVRRGDHEGADDRDRGDREDADRADEAGPGAGDNAGRGGDSARKLQPGRTPPLDDHVHHTFSAGWRMRGSSQP